MESLVALHSWVRWVVVVVGIAAVVVPLLAIARPPLLPTVRTVLMAYVVVVTLQVLLGVVLWVGQGRWDGDNAFFSFIHPLAMVVGTGVAHTGLARARRAEGAGLARNAAIFAVVSLAIITAAVPTASWGG